VSSAFRTLVGYGQRIRVVSGVHTLMPSLEKHGATAELSSSASLSRMGNFSTADMGMSPL
jgi:hypothetical protein